MRAEVDVLIEGFEYDLWANLLWRQYLDAQKIADPDSGILAHVFAAQKIWLLRCRGTSLDHMPDVGMDVVAIQVLHDGWVDLLRDNPENPMVEYQRTTGETYRRHLFHIARHVLDHGTYHRGELRGLCRTRDDWEFPESGFIGFAMEREP